MNFILAAEGLSGFDWFNSDLTVGDALLIFIIGFVCVFVVLALLVGLVYLIRKRRTEAEPTAPVVQKSGVSDEEVAAVMAALTAYFEPAARASAAAPPTEDAPPFVVRRIYRKP